LKGRRKKAQGQSLDLSVFLSFPLHFVLRLHVTSGDLAFANTQLDGKGKGKGRGEKAEKVKGKEKWDKRRHGSLRRHVHRDTAQRNEYMNDGTFSIWHSTHRSSHY
jgi:hypothetical protein